LLFAQTGNRVKDFGEIKYRVNKEVEGIFNRIGLKKREGK